MFVNENYDNYKYLVDVSDNYVILTNQSSVYGEWQHPETYDVIYQYFNPSTLVIEETRTTTSSQNFDRIDVTSDFWSRPDSHQIFSTGMIITFFAIFILNLLTRLIRKGRCFFWLKKNFLFYFLFYLFYLVLILIVMLLILLYRIIN